MIAGAFERFSQLFLGIEGVLGYSLCQMWESEFQKFISDYLYEARQKNRRFSQRALAKKLRISSSTLSDVINGRRHVTPAKALKILDQIEDRIAERECVRTRIMSSVEQRVPLSSDNYDLILDWLFIGILCALELDTPPRNAAELAKVLGVKLARAERALKRLAEIGMLRQTEDGIILENKYFETTDELPDVRIAQAHIDGMERAREALLLNSVHDRDFTSLIVAGDAAKFAAAKRLVRRFLNQLSRTLTGKARNEVYKVNVQIFPLTSRGHD